MSELLTEVVIPSANPEHLLTPATVISLSRPLAAEKVAHMVSNGERGTWPYLAYVPASDAEGKVARLIDKHFPGSGWGTTKAGTEIDWAMDSAAFMVMAQGVMRGPLVSRRAKAAVGLVLGSEMHKAAAILPISIAYKKASGERLKVPVDMVGKFATAAKFAALSLAVVTHELDPGKTRNEIGNLSLGLAAGGLVLNGLNVRRLSSEAHEMLESARSAASFSSL